MGRLEGCTFAEIGKVGFGTKNVRFCRSHDTRARGGFGNTYNYIAGLLQKKGDYTAALDSFKKALSIRESLAKSDPANEQFRLNVAETQMHIGGLYETMATKAHVAQRQVMLCQEGRLWLERSLPIYERMQAEG